MSRLNFKDISFWAKEFVLPLKAKAQHDEMWRDQTQKIASGQSAALSWEGREQNQCSAQDRTSQPSRQVWPLRDLSQVRGNPECQQPCAKAKKGTADMKSWSDPPWRTRPGNGHWEHVLQLLSRQQHGCSYKRHSYSYILEEVPHEALAEGRSSLKLILTWAFNISLRVPSFKQDKYSP